MPSKKEISDATDEVLAEWNLAEEAIKLAEQVCRKIVNPAIYELRYAGRRLVEALALPDSDPEKLAKLKDAHFDCCRARHDAMDAATSKISADIDNAVEKLGAQNVLTNFSDVADLLAKLGSIRDKIVLSRGNRNNREAIYATIQEESLPEIVALYRKFKASEPLLIEAGRADRKSINRAKISGYGGLLLGGIALLVTVYFGLS